MKDNRSDGYYNQSCWIDGCIFLIFCENLQDFSIFFRVSTYDPRWLHVKTPKEPPINNSKIEILMEKYHPIASLSGYPNATILHSAFLTSQRQITKMTLQSVHKMQKSCWIYSTNIQKAIFMQKILQMIIQRVKFRKSLGDALNYWLCFCSRMFGQSHSKLQTWARWQLQNCSG